MVRPFIYFLRHTYLFYFYVLLTYTQRCSSRSTYGLIYVHLYVSTSSIQQCLMFMYKQELILGYISPISC